MTAEHTTAAPEMPARVVILGAGGFVSGATERHLRAIGVATLPLSRRELDLRSPDAARALAERLRPDDSVLFAAARAPVKSTEMLLENLAMGKSVCDALAAVAVRHVVYVSSDAVYADSDAPLTENSCAQPASLHGLMHLAREVMLANVYSGPLCFLRPTLIFGEDDPHDGYGPNRFVRQARKGEEIVLFGEGEEQRDHVWVEDVADVATQVLLRRTRGVLNVASGVVTSFRDIAKRAAESNQRCTVRSTARVGAMPHNGYRPFDTTAVRASLDGHRFKTVLEWIDEQAGDVTRA